MKRQFMLGVAAVALTMGLSACQRGDAPKADAAKATAATSADTTAATMITEVTVTTYPGRWRRNRGAARRHG